MLTRLDILKLEFIYRVIEYHNKKLFLNLYQVERLIVEYKESKDNLLKYASVNFDYVVDNDLENLKACYQTIDTNYNISEKKELTSQDIQYLFEQADFQMSHKNA